LFGIKECKCPEDEHIEYYTVVPEPETPIKDWPCDKHNYYRKSCDDCREIRK